MIPAPRREDLERRALVLAPIGRDAELIAETLIRDRVLCRPFLGVGQLLEELEQGAAMLILAEEALPGGDVKLAEALSRQPPWSDLPVLVLTRTGADSEEASRAVGMLGNVTLLERPLRPSALRSAARSALRARDRQYQARAYLIERDQANERKDQFLATLAHELRNPLAPIRSSLHYLRLSGVDSSTAPFCQIMERQVNQMVRLVDDLLDVSRITRGKIELRREPVTLDSIVATAVETSRPLIESARHTLTVALPPEPLPLDADPVRLAQVFSNLLNNAAKYTDPGGTIEIRARRAGDWIEATVQDSGLGLSPEHLPRVFEMFAQVEGGARRAQGGLGIGLTLVRTLVEMHGGTVEAASDGVGRGSRFTVRLPVGVTAQYLVPKAAVPPLQSVPPHRVLVVDDNRDAADTLAALLRFLGATTEVRYDGLSALDAATSFRPRICFLDLGMPGMDGFELAERLRSRSEADGRVLVALSGWGQPQARDRARVAGFDHHLTKPVDREAITSLLASIPPAPERKVAVSDAAPIPPAASAAAAEVPLGA